MTRVLTVFLKNIEVFFSVLFLMAKRKCKLSAFEGTEIRPSSSSPQGWYLVIITMNSDVTVDL
jgi:hypothetical protein